MISLNRPLTAKQVEMLLSGNCPNPQCDGKLYTYEGIDSRECMTCQSVFQRRFLGNRPKKHRVWIRSC